MAIDGVERLGYYNGQRLEASDLRLEQRYHIDVRRLLNRGLFTPGVVNGLEVDRVEQQARKVRVREGVALDPLGREIVLRHDAELDVPNQKPTTGIGYFLIARYSERLVAGDDPWCDGDDGAPTPARVREEPVLEWSEIVPAHQRCQQGTEGIDCGVLLALVVLDNSCKVDHIQTGVRDYARPTHVSQVQAFSFEGEKDVDKDNPKVLNFRVRGGSPASVTLYLWGEKFSSLYYTELGKHTHTFDKTTGPTTTSLAAHQHSLSNHTHSIPGAAPHHHDVRVNRNDLSLFPPGFPSMTKGRVFAMHSPPGQNDQWQDQEIGAPTKWMRDAVVTFEDDAGNAVATVAPPSPDTTGDATPTAGNGSEVHQHSIPESVFAGVVDTNARSGAMEVAHGYLDDLKVELDGADVTDLFFRYVPQSWGTLGNGQKEHPLNRRDGTGPIDLLAIAAAKGVDLTTDVTHQLTFRVAHGGGKVIYNLYVA